MRIDIAGGVPVLASSGGAIERSESVTQAEVDGGSDWLVLACELDGLIETVLKFFRLAYERE